MTTDLVPVTSISRDQRVAGLVDVFVRSRRSPDTRRVYRIHLNTWVGFCAERGIDPLESRHAYIQLWLEAREQAGDAEGTRAARLAAVNSWYRWLMREGVVTLNPANLGPEEKPKFNSTPTPALSNEQAERLQAAADADSLRCAALVALLLFTGARIGELLSADLSSIGQEAGISVLRITGKGRKKRSLPLIPAVYLRLASYLDSRSVPGYHVAAIALLGQTGTTRIPLLATATGGRLSATQVRRDLLRLAKAAGLDPEVIAALTPHSTRATYATSNLAAGTPLRDVQYALGHADPRTTEGYDRSDVQLDQHPSTRLATLIRPPAWKRGEGDEGTDQ